MANNPICVGFRWRQAFLFPQGFFEDGDVIRAEFRRFPKAETLLASVCGDPGAVISDRTLFIELTPEQTTEIASRGSKVVTNFVLVRAADEIPIAQIITIPVVQLPTRPR